MTCLMQPDRGGLGVVIIFRMSSIRIYPSYHMNQNWFLLLLMFTARNSSCEKVMLSQACVSHSVHRRRVLSVTCPFWGGYLWSQVPSGGDMSTGWACPGGDVYVQGWVCLGGGYMVGKSIGWVYPGLCEYAQWWVPTLLP